MITLDYDILSPLTGLTFWHGSFYLIFSLIVDLGGLALIAGLLYMMYRRGWMALPKLDYGRPDRVPGDPDYDRSSYRREDWAFLWTLILIAVTGFLLEAARLVWLQADPTVWDYRWWSPVGAATAHVLMGFGIGPEGGEGFRMGLWWFHGLLALGFIGLIPYTKVKHIFTAMGSLMAVAIRTPSAACRWPMSTRRKSALPSSATSRDKYLLNLDACTKCGRCHEACPANNAGYPLSPRDLVLTLRELRQ